VLPQAHLKKRTSPLELVAATALSTVLVVYAALYPTTFTWHIHKEPYAYGVVIAMVGAIYLGVGIFGWYTRPGNRVGLLMIGVGLGWLSYQLSWLPDPAGLLQYPTNQLELPFLAWLALAYPIGHLRNRFEQLVVAFAWATWSWGQGANLLLNNLAPCDRPPCPPPFKILAASSDQASGIFSVSNYASLALTATIVVLIVSHWVQASHRARRSIAPLLWMAGPPVAWVFVTGLQQQELLLAPPWLWPWFNLALTTVPVGYLYWRIENRLDRGRISDLLLDLGSGATAAKLRETLSRTLHDPGLELVYWLPEAQRFVDLSGRVVDLPTSGDTTRTATVLDRGGEPLAAVIHDKAVEDDPELMSAATAAVRMAIDNSRLQALVRSQLDEVRASRMRIVSAQDEERRRLERDLHDGAQQRLVTLSLLLGEARGQLDDSADPALRAALNSAASEVGEALIEVRELARGIHPAVLTRSGLVAAIKAIAERSPVPVSVDAEPVGRFAPVIEAAAYFVVSESVVNAAKHARANLVTVVVRRVGSMLRVDVFDDGRGGADDSRGSGLRGLTDRIRAVGGQLTVNSPEGGGTLVRLEIPCG
jgi:signal transduction histidine kinase